MPVLGTRSIEHLDENLKAATLEIGANATIAASALLPPNVLAGARYPAPVQAQIDTELLGNEELA